MDDLPLTLKGAGTTNPRVVVVADQGSVDVSTTFLEKVADLCEVLDDALPA